MDMHQTSTLESGVPEYTDQQIKEHLQTVLPEEIYTRWIAHCVLEEISEKQVVMAYYGEESLKEFKKEDREIVRLQISTMVGYVQKMKIRKKRGVPGTSSVLNSEAAKKHFKVMKLFGISLLFAAITFAFLVLICNYISNRSFRETFYSTSSIKADNKVRILQISDLHNSTYGKHNQTLLHRIEKLHPDIILFTGDCVESGKGAEEKVVSLCTAAAKIAPTYYIYGNNEVKRYYDTPLTQDALDEAFGFYDENRNPELLIQKSDSLEQALERGGVKVLKNEKDTILVGKTDVDIYGVLTSNPSAFWSYGGESFDAFLYENPNNLKITVIHEPFVFEEFSPEYWGDVMVCGHTHGGSVRVPILGPLYTHEGGLFPARQGDYVYGRYDVAGSPLIVSSGLDNKTIFRINNKPEITVIDVNRF